METLLLYARSVLAADSAERLLLTLVGAILTVPLIVGQKQDAGDWTLTITLEMDGEVVDTVSTSAEYGIAQVVEK